MISSLSLENRVQRARSLVIDRRGRRFVVSPIAVAEPEPLPQFFVQTRAFRAHPDRDEPLSYTSLCGVTRDAEAAATHGHPGVCVGLRSGEIELDFSHAAAQP